MIDLRHLRQFVAVAEELHFGRAAQRLHMTQPPLTQAVHGLEAALEVQLFDRSKRAVTLTPGGEALLVRARRLLRAADELPLAVKAAAEGLTGQLRLAFVSTVAYGPLPHLLGGFRVSNPDVSLHLREATFDVQLAAFGADEVDAGFVVHAPGAAPPGFAALTVLAEPLVLALPVGHAAAATQRTLRFEDIASDPLVIFPRNIGPSLFDAVLSFYRVNGITPHIGQEAIQMQTIVSLVSAGMGVAWVPEALTQLQRSGVVYRHVQDVPLTSETSLIWNKQALPVVERFISHVREAIDSSTLVRHPAGVRHSAGSSPQ
jgi:DNA-binding transcriptional LysR family regulator